MIANWLRMSGSNSSYLIHVLILRMVIFIVFTLHLSSRSALSFPVELQLWALQTGTLILKFPVHWLNWFTVIIKFSQQPKVNFLTIFPSESWARVICVVQQNCFLSGSPYYYPSTCSTAALADLEGFKDSIVDVSLHAGQTHFSHLL